MNEVGPVVFTGFMGCGKTAVASAVAALLSMPMVDLDEEITRREGRSPAEIISSEGEPAFRLIETEVLGTVLMDSSIGVIALGGGAWMTEANRELIALQARVTVWLDAPFEVCWERIEASGADRPLGSSKERARELYNQRRPSYGLLTRRMETSANESLDSLVSRVCAEITGG